MAVKYDLSPDFLNNQILNFVLQTLASDPGTAIEGKIFYHSGDNAMKISVDGTTWATLATLDDLSGAGVSLEVVMDALGTGALVGGANIDVTYDDAANSDAGTITIDVTGLASTDLSDFTTAVNALVNTGISNLVDSAPGLLDTLNELAAALGDDPNFAATVNAALAARNQTYTETYGDGSATSFNIDHPLGSKAVTVEIFEVSTDQQVFASVTTPTINRVVVVHTVVPTSNQYRVVVQGRAD